MLHLEFICVSPPRAFSPKQPKESYLIFLSKI
jgi:hypothetical protein